ncbi:TetR family transcriptional regulator [Cellulomonas sp. McL0617]|uniref:TetR/AcrR family transcriptional regulator n=1 Tax=Cellulomonas sp. McL0617 TaxID=3415675 RepID=UPI003CF8CBCC
MVAVKSHPGRPASGGRDARVAILAAARSQFASRGFERTTVRAVAGDAGVDVALIYHYFESKAGLLDAVLAVPPTAERVRQAIAIDEPTPGRAVVETALRLWDEDVAVRELALAMTRAALSRDDALHRLRDLHTTFVLDLVSQVIREDDRELRAALVAAQLNGLLQARYLFKITALAAVELDVLVDAVAPVIDHYLSDDLDEK